MFNTVDLHLAASITDYEINSEHAHYLMSKINILLQNSKEKLQL